ncbi:hypothetical protein CPLU01_15436 [Colletotrichum plurivorum]|uniref:Uncharacterized protein n=1 Tax=Colletotrichum plurivorum TaxID=2175906 RepID=A0A8H6JBB1_9PEZI|nr:hypothetical protein CPLU01_15436 [Colletotrichum plurivorum]
MHLSYTIALSTPAAVEPPTFFEILHLDPYAHPFHPVEASSCIGGSRAAAADRVIRDAWLARVSEYQSADHSGSTADDDTEARYHDGGAGATPAPALRRAGRSAPRSGLRYGSRSSVEGKLKAWMEGGQPSGEAYEFRGAAAVPAAQSSSGTAGVPAMQPSSGAAGGSSAADLSLAGLNLKTDHAYQQPAGAAYFPFPVLHDPGDRRTVAFEQQQEREETDDRHANIVGAFPGTEGLSFGFDQQPQGLASGRRPSFIDATSVPEPFAPPTRASEHFASSTRIPEPLQLSTTPDKWASSAARRRRRLEPPPRVPEHFTVTTTAPLPLDDLAEVPRPRNEGRQRREPEPSAQVQPMDDEELREWYRWWRRRHAEKQMF